MTLTNKGAFELLQYMSGLHETGRLGFFIAKNMRLLQTELTEYISFRNEAIAKWAEPRDGGLFVPNEHVQDFISEMKPYDDIEMTFSPALVDSDTFISGTLDSNDMFTLDWMIEE